jgi:hypothetical protein
MNRKHVAMTPIKVLITVSHVNECVGDSWHVGARVLRMMEAAFCKTAPRCPNAPDTPQAKYGVTVVYSNITPLARCTGRKLGMANAAVLSRVVADPCVALKRVPDKPANSCARQGTLFRPGT